MAVKNLQYQISLSKDSVEGDLSDLYEIDDDYSENSGNIYYSNFIVSNNVIFWFEANLNLIDKTTIVCTVQEKNSKNGYRQLGPIGNLPTTHSYGDCRSLLHIGGAPYHNCLLANAKMDQQNIIALTTKVLELTKR